MINWAKIKASVRKVRDIFAKYWIEWGLIALVSAIVLSLGFVAISLYTKQHMSCEEAIKRDPQWVCVSTNYKNGDQVGLTNKSVSETEVRVYIRTNVQEVFYVGTISKGTFEAWRFGESKASIRLYEDVDVSKKNPVHLNPKRIISIKEL